MAPGAFALLLALLPLQTLVHLVQAQSRLSFSAPSYFSPLLSWTQNNHPSPLSVNSYTESPLGLNVFSPIVSSSSFASSEKGFSFGFISMFPSAVSSPTSIFLAVCLGSGLADAAGRIFAFPVWVANAHRPLIAPKQGIVGLHLNAHRDLLVYDGDGSVVWAVRDALIDAIELRTDGNLVMYNYKNETVWQSFDSPRDILLQGQALPLGGEIGSSNSLYAAKMKKGGLLFFMKSSYAVSLSYFLLALNKTVEDYYNQWIMEGTFALSRPLFINLTQALDDGPSSSTCYDSHNSEQPYAMLEGQDFTVNARDCLGNLSVSWPYPTYFLNPILDQRYDSDFVRLENDGVMHGYTFLHINGSHYFSSSNSGSPSCFAPNACGPHGICASFQGHVCRCPSYEDNPNLTSNAFTYVDPSNPSMGCRRAVPLKCKEGPDYSLMEIPRTTFISLRAAFEAAPADDNMVTLNTCRNQCHSNCSCAGFYYHRPTSFCLPFTEGMPLANVSLLGNLKTSDFSTYLKVQISSTSNVSQQPHVTAPASGKGKRLKVLVSTLIVGGVLVAGCILFSLIWSYRSGSHKKNSELNVKDPELENIIPLLPSRYTYKELSHATNGFSRIVGKGGSGTVYEGVLADSRRVAVKRLDMVRLGVKQFLTEVATIGSICHYNIVQLYGFCSEGSNRLLVYEYMENSSLDRWIFDKQGRDKADAVEACYGRTADAGHANNGHQASSVKGHVLSWETRFNIALGTARALAYLHEDSPRPILHFDIKPENILLDANYVAKVADFGLSQLMERGTPSVMHTGVRGTIGYMAPEWLSHSLASKKCDVYSYGMVLLELVGGRRAKECVLTDTEEWYFPAWAAHCCREGRVMEMVDERLRGGYDVEEVRKVVHVAFLCIHRSPSQRPSMGMVYKLLEGSLKLPGEGLCEAAQVQHLPFDHLLLERLSQSDQPSADTILMNINSPSNQLYSSIEGR